MANLALVFDILAKDGASGPFRNVGNAAERASKQTSTFGTAMSGAMKLASGALLGAGLVEGFKALYNAADESRKIAALTSQVIKSTGGAAQVSAKQVSDLAGAIAKKTGVDDEAIQSGQNLLLTFTNVKNQVGAGNDIFNQATKVMTDMSVALGTDASGSAIQLGKALNDPVKGVAALQKVGVSFTASQKEQIKTLVEAGDTLGAQKIILAELGKEFGGAAEAAATPLGKLQQRIGDLAEQIGGYLLPIVDQASTFFADKLLPALSDVGSVVGSVVLPAFQAIGAVVGTAAGLFNALPGPLQTVALALGAFVLLRGPVTSMFETVALKALYMKDAVAGASLNMDSLKGGLANLGRALGPGLAIGAAVIIVDQLVRGFKSLTSASDEAQAASEGLAKSLTLTNKAMDRESVRNEIESIDGLVGILSKAGIASSTAIDGLLGNAAAQDRVTGALQRYMGTLNPRLGEVTAEDARQAILAYDELATGYDGAAGSARFFGEESTGAAAGATATGDAAEGSIPQIDAATAALEAWLGQLQQVGSGFVEPLDTYKGLLDEKTEAERAAAEKTAAATTSSSDSWRDYVGDVSVSLDELATNLEEQLTAQDNWRTNILTITQRGGLEVGQAIAAMGEEGVTLAAQLANGTDAEFQRMAALIVEDTRNGGAGAAAELDGAMKIMAAIGAAGADATAKGIAAQLGLGVGEVARIAAQYGVTLASGINPILGAMGKPNIHMAPTGGNIGYAEGGYTGPGSKYTPAGIVHAGEFVFTKEQTSRAGVGTLKAYAASLRGYASGGFVSAADVPRPYSTAPYGVPISTAGDATMQKGFDEVSAWLKANTEAAMGGTAGGGAVGGAWSSLWNLVKAAIPAARINSAYRPGDPGYHGRNKAVDFGYGSGPGGAGSAGLASINRLLHDQVGGNLAELIYDGLGDDRPDLKNGRPLTYNSGTRAAHRNHVHAAVYDSGGLLPPGLTLAYNGTGRNETIRTAGQESALNEGMVITGTLEIGGDGLARIIDGRVVSALTGATSRGNYNP